MAKQKSKNSKSVWVAGNVAGAVLFAALSPQAAAQDAAAAREHQDEALAGEVVYVPVYTHISTKEKNEVTQPLSSTLTIHNVDPSTSIRLTSVRYYDHAGTQIKDYIENPRFLGPFASASFVLDIGEDRGGVGANFVVEWQAAEKVVSPIIQAVMIGGAGTQGLSFVTQGKVISARP